MVIPCATCLHQHCCGGSGGVDNGYIDMLYKLDINGARLILGRMTFGLSDIEFAGGFCSTK